MTDPDITLPVPKPPAMGGAGGVSLSQAENLMAAGAGAFDTQRSTRGHEWHPPSTEDLQRQLPQYEISAFIARGGMGAVYKGMQKALKRAVAIKVLPPEIKDGDMQFKERFKHEAQAMARLSHPNIVAVFDAGETPDGLLFFVMEFIEGTDVAQLITAEGSLEPQRAIQITTAVCEALAFAHEEGIIHRDIKPSNIMLDKRGRVKVADFGLAKTVAVDSTLLTGSNVAMGTPDFIAPEAFIPGIKMDQRADLYAVGVMLYQMLTGKIPRGRFHLPSLVVPQLDRRLDAIVDKAMQTDREQRYSSAIEMKTDVERVTPKEEGTDSPDRAQSIGGAAAKNEKAQKSVRAPLLIAAGVVGLALGAFFAMRKPENKAVSIASASGAPISRPSSIKLWDTPEKVLNLGKANIKWENNAIHLTDKAGLSEGTIKQADMSVRAEVLMNAGSASVQICGRVLRDDTGPKGNYNLALKTGLTAVKLSAQTGEVSTKLQEWPLSRAYREDEWLPLELRIVGNEITALAEGRVLGTVKDSSVRGSGGVQLYATQDGWFRNVEYVPLDKPAQSAPRTGFLSPELWQDALNEKTDFRLTGALERTAEGLRVTGPCSANPGRSSLPHRDGAVRMVAAYSGMSVQLRARMNADVGTYSLSVRDGDKLALMRFDNFTKAASDIRTFPLYTKLQPGQDYEMELRVVGTTLTAKFNDEVLGTASDSTYTEGYFGAGVGAGSPGSQAAPSLIKTLEVLYLDAAPPLQAPAGVAIKLWETPEKLGNEPRVEWQDSAVHLIESTGLYDKHFNRDAIVRASIRMNKDAKGPQMHLRHRGNQHYRLALNPVENYVVLVSSDGDKQVTLKSWPLAHRYAESDWLRLELQAVGDRLTVTADGVVLGEVIDSQVSEAGVASIFGTNSWFRDIEYVPLN